MRRPLAILPILLGILPMAGVAAAEPPPFEIVAEEPVKLTFDEGGQATVTLLVINRTDGAVAAVPVLVDQVSGVIAESTGQPERGAFAVVGVDPGEIRADSSALVTITIGRGVGAPDANVELTLLLGTGHQASVLLSTTPAVAALVSADAEPASATVRIECPWGPIVPCEESDGLPVADGSSKDFAISGITADGSLPGDTEHELTSDSGGRAIVSIAGLDADDEEAKLEIDVVSATRPGTYTGTISLDPGIDEGPTIDLTANVAHAPFWPLLTLAAGVLAAYAVVHSRDYRRPRELVTLHLRRAGEMYAQPIGGCPAEDEPTNWMRGAFRLTGPGVLAAFDAQGDSFGDKAFAEIVDARDADGLAAAEARVRDIESLVRLWRAECSAAQDLQAIVDEHSGEEQQPAVIARARKLLVVEQPIEWGASGGKTLTAQATDHVTALRDQATAIALYEEARKWFERAEKAWDALDGAIQGKASQIDPIDPAPQWAVDRDQHDTLAEWQAADVDLLMARKLALYRALQIPQEPGLERKRFSSEEVTIMLANEASDRARVKHARAALPDHHRVETRPAAAILGDLKDFDFRYFLIVALVAVAVYFVTIYPDENFGDRWQYLTAFLAGMAGTVAIDWALLPWFSAYRPPDKA
jgi:hypothetical protein